MTYFLQSEAFFANLLFDGGFFFFPFEGLEIWHLIPPCGFRILSEIDQKSDKDFKNQLHSWWSLIRGEQIGPKDPASKQFTQL